MTRKAFFKSRIFPPHQRHNGCSSKQLRLLPALSRGVPAAGLSLSSCSPAQLVSGLHRTHARASQMRRSDVFVVVRNFAHSTLGPAPSRRHQLGGKTTGGAGSGLGGGVPLVAQLGGGIKYTHGQPHPKNHLIRRIEVV